MRHDVLTVLLAGFTSSGRRAAGWISREGQLTTKRTILAAAASALSAGAIIAAVAMPASC